LGTPHFQAFLSLVDVAREKVTLTAGVSVAAFGVALGAATRETR